MSKVKKDTTRKFEVDSSDLAEREEKGRRTKAKVASPDALLKRKSGGLALETQTLAGEKRKAKLEEKHSDQMKMASYADRIKGGAVDLGICLGLYFVASKESLTYKTEELYFKVTEIAGVELELSDTILDYGLIAINFCILYFVAQVLVTTFFQKSIGKMVSGTHLVSFDADKVGLFQAIKREMIMKPIGVAFLVGFILPFTDEDNQSFHDKFGGTLVAKD